MENNIDIENLFRNTLENAEVPPPAGAWEAIQAKIGAGAASATAGATVTGLGAGKIAAIVVTALGLGLGAGYFVFKGSNQPQKEQTPVQENVAGTENTPADHVTTNFPADVKITDVTSVNKTDKVVSVVEVKKGNETKKILVEIPASPETGNSIVNQWLSPKNDKVSREVILQRIMNELEKADNADHTDKGQIVNEKDHVLVQTLKEDEVIAGIQAKADPERRLTIHFSNLTEAEAYEWDFGDNTTSRESTPVHTYATPGFYVISLKVYDRNGKVYTHKDGLEVTTDENAGTIHHEELSGIDRPNVFTPNGDGKTDEFYFTGKNIESFTVTIVDSYGKTVYSSNDIRQRWNGTDRHGHAVPSGNYHYMYKAVGKDGKVHQYAGTVTVSR